MEEPESFPPDSEDVREQIEQQRALAAQLREKLEHEEMQLASKEQQNELLKSKLSLLKSRTKSKRNAAPNDRDDRKIKNANDPSANSPKHCDSKYARKQPGNSANKGKINILREQLEQNRLRFERHGLELSEDTRSMEAMVEQLRNELQERDVAIQQLQEGQVPEVPQVGANIEKQISEPADVATRLLQKEQEVNNLTNEVSILQASIHELQENLKEKDCVIEARTQAISLLSEDMSKKWRANVDMLEETRQQMQMMQENFVRIEAGLNTEIDQLNLQLQTGAKKLSQAEQNVRAIEIARNDLSSQNAELQAELKSLKEAPRSGQGLEEAKLKIEELSQALSEANKLTVKLKADHKTKVKALNKQIDSLRKESNMSGELVELQNHIAELEEEKGNLQLNLIEVEERTGTQDQKIMELQEAISELQSQKVLVEMKLVELEEQHSSSGKMDQEIAELKLKLEDRDNEILGLKASLHSADLSHSDALSRLQKELEEAKIALNEWQYRYEHLEKQQAEEYSESRAQTVSYGLEQGLEIPSERQEPLGESSYLQRNLEEKVRNLEKSMHEKQVLVQELEELVQNSVLKIESMSSIERDCSNCITMRQHITDQEAQIARLEVAIGSLKEENENLKLELKEVANMEHLKSVESATDTSDLQRQLVEVSGELDLKREECVRLEGKLKAQLEKAKKIAVNLKVKTLANKELEEKVGRYEVVIQNNQAAVDQLAREKEELVEKWQMEVSEKNTALNQVSAELAMKEMDIQNLNQELETKSSITYDLQDRLSALQAHLNELQLIVDEKSAAIEKLDIALAEQKMEAESGKLVELEGIISSIQSQLASESEEKQAAILKLESFTKQAKLKLAKEKKIRTELLEKQRELEAHVAEKSNDLAGVREQHEKEMENIRLEKQRFETLLDEQQEQLALLRQQLEQERSRLQYASENVNAEEAVEIAQDLQTIASAETFQNEVEYLCSSFNSTSPQDVLPILEEEKIKTMNELSSSFEALHSQIVARLHGRPDLHGDRKLFAELRNLITRVINRTAALEDKIKKIVADSNAVLQSRLLEAEGSIQTLEEALSEARNHLNWKEEERTNLQESVTNLSKERWELCQQIQEENQKSVNLEIKLKEISDESDLLGQAKASLLEQVTEKDRVIQDLQDKLESATSYSDQLQLNLSNINQQNGDLSLNLENLYQECNAWKSKCHIAEQHLSNSNVNASELKVSYEEAVRRCETLEQRLNESVQLQTEIQLKLQTSTEEVGKLQEQLSDALQAASQLQSELSDKSNSFLQQTMSWDHEREQLEGKIHDLAQQLHLASEKTVDENTQLTSTQSSSCDEVNLLHQQLAEKTAELENYQRRLIQLQMAAPESATPLLSGSSNVSEAFQAHEKVTSKQRASEVETLNASSIFDAFKPAASFFDTATEVSELQTKIQDMDEQLRVLLSEKAILESERNQLHSNLDNLNKELNASRSDMEATQISVTNLQLKVTELSTALHASEICVEQEKCNTAKLQDEVKDLQWKLETEKYEKEKVENELKVRAQEEAEERPDIPQTLDTHVSSLQDSGSGFNRAEKTDSFDTEKADESLMECNMSQLESELRGMVMSQLESSLKQEGENTNTKENSDISVSEIRALITKLSKIEEEKNTALSQIDSLKAEIEVLSQSAAKTTNVTSQTMFSVSDTLMNDDDSWGWGAETAHLEMQHQQQKIETGNVLDDVSKELKVQIDSLKLENESLEKDKVQLSEDLKASQIRAAKLTRKLRDLKSKYDEISDKSRSTDSPFDGLDQAIEEERMKQLQVLEKELKDAQTEFTAVKADRDRLQKQVDVLSSANERMVEAKERQDLEVEMWQKRSKDLTSQVQALEWKVQELEEGKEENITVTRESPRTLPSLPTETLNAVEVDQLLKENHTWNANYENLMKEYQKLRAQCLAEGEQRTQIDALVTQQKGIIERLEHEKTYFQDVYDSLKMDYESACAQLASKQTAQNEDAQIVDKVAELEVKLSAAEKHLQDTINQLHVLSSDNSELQARCSLLTNERDNILRQLEQGQSALEAKAGEISRLQENISRLEGKSANSATQHTPVNESFIAQESFLQSSSANSTVLNWGEVVSSGEQQSGDIFDSIASSSAQGLEDQLLLKETEMQKDKRMIETLKRTMEESEQEWSQIIEYHKSQLELANKTIGDLQVEVQALRQFASNVSVGSEQEQTIHREELQNLIFAKDKEIESLQMKLAVGEEMRKKLEEELLGKKTEVYELLSEIPQKSTETSSEPEVKVASTSSASHTLPISSVSMPIISSLDKNLSNELDLALYMLHERDVRCEELTLELTQLLEERDGLQLRLSNAIRTNEELRERLKLLLPNQPSDVNVNAAASPQGEGLLASSLPVEGSHYTGREGADLQNKLTELRTIGYNHDKRLREDSEYRHQQQMRMMSPSPPTIMSGSGSDPTTNSEINSVSTLDGTPTNSNNVDQSTSNESQGSLLGWFWGRN